MSEHQARFVRDVYDYEHDEPHGRRRRPVADWGVGEDVFAHMPRRRFSRAAEGPPRDRRFATRDLGAGDAGGHGAGGEPGGAAVDLHASDAAGHAAARDDTPAAHERRTIVIDRPDDVPSEIAAITADRDLGDDAVEETVEPAARRTVRIAGRPEGALPEARFHPGARRRRPPAERLGPRPDRLAAWAFALGILLILIAILTAH
jgi:hypothetical protein